MFGTASFKMSRSSCSGRFYAFRRLISAFAASQEALLQFFMHPNFRRCQTRYGRCLRETRHKAREDGAGDWAEADAMRTGYSRIFALPDFDPLGERLGEGFGKMEVGIKIDCAIGGFAAFYIGKFRTQLHHAEGFTQFSV